MKRLLLLPALAAIALTTSGVAIGQSSPVTAIQACAAYTASGEALMATVSSGTLTLARGRSAAGAQTFAVTLADAMSDVGQPWSRSQPCDISISRRGDEAAVGVHYRSRDNAQGVVIYRFNLAGNAWGKTQLAPPPAASRNGLPRATAFAGYWMDTHDLVTTDSAAEAHRYDATGASVETKDISREFTSDILSGVDAAHNRVWLECASTARLFPRYEGCTLHTMRLFGGPGVGPQVTSAARYVNTRPAQWAAEDFFAYADADTLMFGGPPASLSQDRQCMWKADLGTGLSHSLCFNTAGSFATFTGQASASRDSAVVAALVESSRHGTAIAGARRSVKLLLADMNSLQQVTTLLPPADSDFAAFAIDHRKGETHAVVNWGAGWEDHTYPDVLPPQR